MGCRKAEGRRWKWAEAGAILAVAVVLVVAAACSRPAPQLYDPEGFGGWVGAEDQQNAGIPDSSPTLERVELIMNEFRFAPVPLTLPAGKQVTLTIRNQGAVVHEFMLGRGRKAGGGYETDLLARAEVEAIEGKGYELEGFKDSEGHGAEVVVGSGGYVTLKLTLPADAKGEWEMGCFVPGHYEAGMKGAVIVK